MQIFKKKTQYAKSYFYKLQSLLSYSLRLIAKEELFFFWSEFSPIFHQLFYE